MKVKEKNIPGIGHRIKSVQNPDVRVSLLNEWAFKTLPRNDVLEYALEVEKITTSKKNNLILNVDGCVGVIFVDIFRSTGIYTDEEIDDIVDIGTLNGIFVLGRTVGMIGHYLDQKRLHTGLYRQPFDEVCYMLPEHEEVLKHREEK